MIYLKKAELKDAKLIFDWANDSEVRKNSFNTKEIEYDEHINWFVNKLKSDQSDIFILYSDHKPLGQIRLDYEQEEAYIGYSIDEKYRGKRYGGMLLLLIENKIVETHANICYLVGKVKIYNVASQAVFERIGYENTNEAKDFIIYRKRISSMREIKEK